MPDLRKLICNLVGFRGSEQDSPFSDKGIERNSGSLWNRAVLQHFGWRTSAKAAVQDAEHCFRFCGFEKLSELFHSDRRSRQIRQFRIRSSETMIMRAVPRKEEHYRIRGRSAPKR